MRNNRKEKAEREKRGASEKRRNKVKAKASE